MRTDIYEKDGNYLIEMDLPGYSKSDIQADLKEGYLTITGSMIMRRMRRRKPKANVSTRSVIPAPAADSFM